MTLDTMARRASAELRAATADVDVDAALRTTLDRSRHRRRVKPLLILATAIVALIVGWSLSGELRRSAEPAPPADAPTPVSVGRQLGAPMSALTPTGWDAVTDRSYVEMRPSDGSVGMRIFMLVPRKVYEPPSETLTPLKDDPIIWMTTHPDLTTSGQFGVDGPAFAWAGTKVDVSLKPKAGAEALHLMPLAAAPGAPPLAISPDDGTFRWTVVYFEDADPLAIAAMSPTPDDSDLTSAVNELLDSIQIEQK